MAAAKSIHFPPPLLTRDADDFRSWHNGILPIIQPRNSEKLFPFILFGGTPSWDTAGWGRQKKLFLSTVDKESGDHKTQHDRREKKESQMLLFLLLLSRSCSSLFSASLHSFSFSLLHSSWHSPSTSFLPSPPPPPQEFPSFLPVRGRGRGRPLLLSSKREDSPTAHSFSWKSLSKSLFRTICAIFVVLRWISYLLIQCIGKCRFSSRISFRVI